MNNKFLYSEKISLENVLKLLFKQLIPMDELKKYDFIKNSLITHFKIIDSIEECDFKDYFIINNSKENIFTFFSNNIGKLTFGFKYNQELQNLNVGISFDNTITDEEIFEKLSTELFEPDFSYTFKENNEVFGQNHERIRILYWLRNIASDEISWFQNIALEEYRKEKYKKGFMLYSELITIQDLIIEAYELLA